MKFQLTFRSEPTSSHVDLFLTVAELGFQFPFLHAIVSISWRGPLERSIIYLEKSYAIFPPKLGSQGSKQPKPSKRTEKLPWRMNFHS